MTTVYLDPRGTAVATATSGRAASAASLLPGALEALRRLCDASYDVVVLATRPLDALSGLEGRVKYGTAPGADLPARAPAPRGSARPARAAHVDGDRPWLIAADEGWIDRERPATVRTIRVGPRPPAARRTGGRFDLEARDLHAAVMEILVRDAMPR